ncbi:MAG: RecX family transcriptional regulator [Bdellovibrio sp.]|nr:RecX family transcriptional regulator [Bdellovibrio sp.]
MIDQNNVEFEQETGNSASSLKFDSAFKRAIKLLNKRDFSITNMKEALARLEFDDQCISDVIEHLLHLHYLDDERISLNLFKKYITKGKGPNYIKSEFLKRGLTFSRDLYQKFLADQDTTPADHMNAILERASRKYLHQCDSLYDFERKVLSYLFRQGLIQDTNEIGLYKSTVRQLWTSKHIQGSN